MTAIGPQPPRPPHGVWVNVKETSHYVPEGCTVSLCGRVEVDPALVRRERRKAVCGDCARLQELRRRGSWREPTDW